MSEQALSAAQQQPRDRLLSTLRNVRPETVRAKFTEALDWALVFEHVVRAAVHSPAPC